MAKKSAHLGWILCEDHIYKREAWADMPVLGDALEDAGCGHEEALRHCREGVEHMRGCWVLDAILGKK